MVHLNLADLSSQRHEASFINYKSQTNLYLKFIQIVHETLAFYPKKHWFSNFKNITTSRSLLNFFILVEVHCYNSLSTTITENPLYLQSSLRALCCQTLKLSRCLCGYRLETLRERKAVRNKVNNFF